MVASGDRGARVLELHAYRRGSVPDLAHRASSRRCLGTRRGAPAETRAARVRLGEPEGPIHIGHARGTFVGDALARLLDAAGYDVTKEFYVNDYGRQVEILGRTVLKRYRQLFGAEIELAEGEYPAEYVIEIARSLKEADGDRWLQAEEAAALPRSMEFAIAANLAAIRETLRLANVTHDVFFSEAGLHADGSVSAIVGAFRERGATYEADQARDTEGTVRRQESKSSQFSDRKLGGTFLATSTEGDDEDRIIQRRDGTFVYLTSDLAYHRSKFERGFDRCVDVFGADHSGHVPRIRAGMRLLGLDDSRLAFVLVQMVRLVRSGEEVKVSKRRGTVFELSDLLEEVELTLPLSRSSRSPATRRWTSISTSCSVRARITPFITSSTDTRAARRSSSERSEQAHRFAGSKRSTTRRCLGSLCPKSAA